MLSSAAFLFLVLTFSGCASPDSFGGSRQAVEAWSQPKGFITINTGPAILGLLRSTDEHGPLPELIIYIEGDGAPWASPWHPPRDPTPLQPIALALAAQDPAPAVLYLGRPCQYLDAGQLATCPPAYWTSQRFAPDVLENYQQILDLLKLRYGTEHFRLVGYSGGGVLAMLLAGTRSDITQVITIAAPIDLSTWTAWHHISPLEGSLDPARFLDLKSLPPAVHFAGEKDMITPVAVIAPFATKTGGKLRLVANFDHACCWTRDWPQLLEETR